MWFNKLINDKEKKKGNVGRRVSPWKWATGREIGKERERREERVARRAEVAIGEEVMLADGNDRLQGKRA